MFQWQQIMLYKDAKDRPQHVLIFRNSTVAPYAQKGGIKCIINWLAFSWYLFLNTTLKPSFHRNTHTWPWDVSSARNVKYITLHLIFHKLAELFCSALQYLSSWNY